MNRRSFFKALAATAATAAAETTLPAAARALLDIGPRQVGDGTQPERGAGVMFGSAAIWTAYLYEGGKLVKKGVLNFHETAAEIAKSARDGTERRWMAQGPAEPLDFRDGDT